MMIVLQNILCLDVVYQLSRSTIQTGYLHLQIFSNRRECMIALDRLHFSSEYLTVA